MGQKSYEIDNFKELNIIILELTNMKDEDYYRFLASFFRALSHPTRLKIAELLLQSCCCVGEIENELGIKQANVSQHLNILRISGIVDYTADGKKRCYRLIKPEIIADFLNCL